MPGGRAPSDGRVPAPVDPPRASAHRRAGSSRAAAVRIVLALGLLAAMASASAHSHLAASTPSDGSTVGEAPTRVELTFTEPVQVAYSLFEALPLPVPDRSGETPSQRDKRVHELASQLSDRALAGKADSKARVDTGVTPAKGATEKVSVALRQHLPPGYYVLVWRVLSEDGHVTHGVVVFRSRSGS